MASQQSHFQIGGHDLASSCVERSCHSLCNKLPTDALTEIYCFLSPLDVSRASVVSRYVQLLLRHVQFVQLVDEG